MNIIYVHLVFISTLVRINTIGASLPMFFFFEKKKILSYVLF